jgi:Zn-dependent protease with chaperone function
LSVRHALLGALLVTGVSLSPRVAPGLPPGSTPREIELGREAADDIAKTSRLLSDEETLSKLQRMLDEIAAVTERPDVEYRPHIVVSPLVNAFVIPGGWVYVTTGLLDAVESDDELAGVLAHEIAHNVNQHAIRRMRETPKGLGLLQLAAIAALVIGGSPEAAILANTAASTITAAVLNGHTVEMEIEADAYGIDYITRTGYDSTGFLTFLERLAGSSGKFIEEELGIYRTHPLTRDRVHSALKRLEETGRPIRRRLVTRAPQPRSRSIFLGGEEVTEILYREERLLLLEGHAPDHAAEVVRTIRWILDHELEEGRIKVVPAEEGVIVQPAEGPACRLTPGDGRVNGDGEVLLAARLRERLAGLVADEQARIRANFQLY